MCTACALCPPAPPRRFGTTAFPSHLAFCFCSEKTLLASLNCSLRCCHLSYKTVWTVYIAWAGNLIHMAILGCVSFWRHLKSPSTSSPFPWSCLRQGMAWSRAVTRSSLFMASSCHLQPQPHQLEPSLALSRMSAVNNYNKLIIA